MKKSDLVFPGENPNDLSCNFIFRCCTHFKYPNTPEQQELMRSVLRSAVSVDDYIDRYLSCEELQNTQAYAVLSARFRQAGHWNRIRHNLGARCFKTYSDAGGVKIGNSGFTTVIRNGRGDGVTRCAVVASGSWNNSFLSFEGCIEGDDINIFDSDCGDLINSKLEPGRYGVYSGHGFVVFERWDT